MFLRETVVNALQARRAVRKVLGRYRYGRLDRTDGKIFYAAKSAVARLKAYLAGGNLEHLLDAANLCEIEFTHPTGPGAHLASLDKHDLHSEPVHHESET